MRCVVMIVGAAALVGCAARPMAPAVAASHAPPANPVRSFSTGAGMATDDGIVYDNRDGQVFIASVSGRVQRIGFVLSRTADTTAPLRVTLVEMTEQGTGRALATGTIDPDTVPTERYRSLPASPTHWAELSDSRARLRAGRRYAILLSSDSTEANYAIYGDDDAPDGAFRLTSQNQAPYTRRPGSFFFVVDALAPASDSPPPAERDEP